MLASFSRMGFGALVLDKSGDLLEGNAVANEILRIEVEPNGNGHGGAPGAAMKVLLARTGGRFRSDSETWLTVPRKGRAPLVLHAIPIGDDGFDGPHTMLVLIDLAARPSPSIETLQRLFSLSPAEAKLALEVGMGKSLPTVREETGLSNNTLRTQLAAVFTKTGTRRQSELVSLVAQVAVLP